MGVLPASANAKLFRPRIIVSARSTAMIFFMNGTSFCVLYATCSFLDYSLWAMFPLTVSVIQHAYYTNAQREMQTILQKNMHFFPFTPMMHIFLRAGNQNEHFYQSLSCFFLLFCWRLTFFLFFRRNQCPFLTYFTVRAILCGRNLPFLS